MPQISTVLVVAVSWYVVTSLVAFVVFAIDKSRAQRVGSRRTPERTLHMLSALGGFPGSMVAMWGIRHKNRKVGFVVITVGLAAVHLAAWVVVVVVRLRGE